ncbi:cupredoxin domain-containing protein [Paenibacillus tarimensis]|uniref:cytochrome C oxidase subunit II n=1 Tax=Paenibacillus tarimensis TaxID=416012 RepID=UPI001F1A402A|nr:cytochrome C oxidase subunit II [Paenibacillus tarimensis]MCF2943184.1 cytochrome C oxidase subunit II [Paenibacillus tarimensis]
MYKWLMFVVFIAASVLGLYLITFNLPEKPVDESASLPEGMVLMKIQASNDFVFDQEVYTVKQGDTVRMKLVNKSGIHGLEIPELGIKLEGDELQKDIVFDKPGEYKIACSIPCGTGHATMISTLVVEAA